MRGKPRLYEPSVATARQREQSRRLSVTYKRLLRTFAERHTAEYDEAYTRIKQQVAEEFGPLPGDKPSE